MTYEESLRVPLLIRAPGGPPGSRVDEVANLVDIVPTILEAVGAPVPDHLDGRSLMPLINGSRQEDPTHGAVSEWNGLLQNMHAQLPMFAPVKDLYIRAIRTRDWKLCANLEDVWELYDLRNDPAGDEQPHRQHRASPAGPRIAGAAA